MGINLSPVDLTAAPTVKLTRRMPIRTETTDALNRNAFRRIMLPVSHEVGRITDWLINVHPHTLWVERGASHAYAGPSN
jgi:hypothetical protein